MANTAADYLHYLHGVNPLGKVYLSNMYSLGAENSVNQLWHTWFFDGIKWDDAKNSLYGPAPGYVVGGGLHPPAGMLREISSSPTLHGGTAAAASGWAMMVV